MSPPNSTSPHGLEQQEATTVARRETRFVSDARPIDAVQHRPAVRGPFLFLGEEKLTVKAVTYGTFAANEDGDLFPGRATVSRDFRMMRGAGVNTIRTYTPPPNWLLEEARQAGLWVLVGIYWEGRDCVFDDPRALRAAEAAVHQAVVRCRKHPDVVLAYVIGNEIPPLTARFFGRRPVEAFLRRLFDVVKTEDPDALVTYGNYPSTEFLQLHFLDFHTLNVYLLEKQAFSAYLDRMLIESKGKPLLLGEVGDDSSRKGAAAQAELLDWTIVRALDKGVCGLCVFSWTDEWVVGGHPVTDWDFGLVARDRSPKAAYDVVRRRFAGSPLDWRATRWPKVSVVVCNYNGAATLDETLGSLERLRYPDYEVVYVDDGSTDESLAIARRHAGSIRIIAQENRGLSVARNVGAHAATGEIVAYTDSDAFADTDWLRHLVLAMESGDFAGAGGPNLTPASDGLIAQFIAMCPGNPTCVLRDNVHADHIAGVNMAFRRDALLAVGGFDPVHTRAGDDVDICWRMEDAGMRLAFSPAAVVWHHRRPSVVRYLKQQSGYGEAEHQLEKKHPERFNLGGYIRWRGRVYTAPRRVSSFFRPFIYHGPLGSAMFQTLYQKEPSYFMDGPGMIQWYLVWVAVLALSPLSLWLVPVGLGLLALSVWTAFVIGFTSEAPINLSPSQSVRKVLTVGCLHFVHPVVRWYGRARARARHTSPLTWVVRRGSVRPEALVQEVTRWFARAKEPRRYWGLGGGQRSGFVHALHKELKARGTSAGLGQEWDNFDILLNGSLAVEGRFYTAPEHYDQALCCGLRLLTTRLSRAVLVITLVVAATACLADPRFAPLLLAPALVWYSVLAARARLRRRLWEAVDAVMAGRGAREFAADATPR